MIDGKIQINRVPVLTLWATTVAERLGFNQDEALSLGKAVASLTAQSKGRRLGIFILVPQEVKEARARKGSEEFLTELCGRQVRAFNTMDGVRAVNRNIRIEAKSGTWRAKFGESPAPAIQT